MKRILTILALVALLAGSAQASVLMEESFDYPVGALSGNDDWSGGTGTVTAGSLTYTGVVSVGNQSAGTRTGDAKIGTYGNALFTTAGTYYIAYLINYDPGDNKPFIAGRDGSGTWLAHMQMGLYGSGYRLEVQGAGNTQDNYLNTGDAVTGANLFLCRWTNEGTAANDEILAMMNPDLSGATDWATLWASTSLHMSVTSQNITVAAVDTWMQNGGAGGPTDEWRIATTTEEALTGIPEPATMLVLACGGILSLLRRRR